MDLDQWSHHVKNIVSGTTVKVQARELNNWLFFSKVQL